jgi:hypothetical protein
MAVDLLPAIIQVNSQEIGTPNIVRKGVPWD